MLIILPIMLCCTAQKFTYYAQIMPNYLCLSSHTLLIISSLGPYSVIISFSSTACILLKLPHGKPLFTLCMLRRTRDAKLL